MARLEEFCAFRATTTLIEERGLWQLVNATYLACKKAVDRSPSTIGHSPLTIPVRSQCSMFNVQ